MSELKEQIKEVIPLKDITSLKILNNLLDADDNLELKTHIHKPKQLTSLFILAEYLKKLDYPKSAKLIDNFIEQYLKYMVSFKRMSRIEIIKALSSFIAKIKDTPENNEIPM